MRMIARPQYWTTCTVLLLPGCSAPEIPPPTRIPESIVWISADNDTIPLIQTTSIGAIDGPSEYELGVADMIVPVTGGGVIVGDRALGGGGFRMRRYDSTGRYVGTFGHPGAGPGEHGEVVTMVRLTDGTLLMEDDDNARMSRWSASGELLAEWRAPTGLGTNVILPANDGWYLERPEYRSRNAEGVVPVTFLHYGFDGVLRDSVFVLPEYYVGPKQRFRAWVVMLPNGTMVTSREDSASLVLRRTGEPVVHVSHDLPRAVYQPGEAEARVAENRAIARRRGQDPNAVVKPTEKPLSMWLFTTPESRIVMRVTGQSVERALPPEAPPTESRWVATLVLAVFDSGGAYLGRFEGPPGTRLPGTALTADRLWLQMEGGDGEHAVTAWQTEGPTPW